jgi:hypothetical protein
MEPNISLHVVYDRSGTIIALAPVGERSVSSSGVPLPRPIAERGQFAATVPLPEDAREKDATAISTAYIVKGRGESARLVLRTGRPKKVPSTVAENPARRSARVKTRTKRR